jgi:hypothetical protein
MLQTWRTVRLTSVCRAVEVAEKMISVPSVEKRGSRLVVWTSPWHVLAEHQQRQADVDPPTVGTTRLAV